MKGLLLKEGYLAAKYCRTYLFIALVFALFSVVGEENLFLIFYPCLLAGMIPLNLIALDERSRWDSYSDTMPVSRGQMVSAKYLIGLFCQGGILVLMGTMQAIRMGLSGNFDWMALWNLLFLLVSVSTISPSICLPFVFRLGAERGRMAYYFMIGFVVAVSFVAAKLVGEDMGSVEIPGGNFFSGLLAAIGILLFLLSWYLSIVFYKKREN